MWFGLYLPQLRMTWDRILERAQAAERTGFDSLWLMDHLEAPLTPAIDTYEGWTIASALAARTSTIRIGHLVLCDALRPPAVLAKMAATLDVVSDGRLDLGIGWGSVPDELIRYGITRAAADERAARLRETLEIFRLMCAGDPFDYEGQFATLHDAIGRPVPVQAHVPIHIGGGGVRLTMPLVAEFADWWNCPGYALDRLDELRPLAGAARLSVQRPIGLAPTAAARDETVATVLRRFGAWGGVIAGTTEEVAAGLVADAQRGVEGFVLQFSDFATPETMEHFMLEVAPRVRAAGQPLP